MNLADAIRQAAHSNGFAPAIASSEPATPPVSVQHSPLEVATLNEQNPPSLEVNPTLNTVRLEIVLSPEQLSSLFRAIVAGQHSVMTLREAAAYLRLPSTVVDQMASEGKLPAFSLDGKWRFTHSALDEWMSARQAEDSPLSRAVGA